MCYLCKPTPRARQISKAIQEAATVWRKKDGYRDGSYGFKRSWGFSHDWTKPPAKPAKLPERPDVQQGDGWL